MAKMDASESTNCKSIPCTGRSAYFAAIRYHGIAVSSTVWMQKMKSERRPTHSMAWEMGPSTRRCNFRKSRMMP